ncbi:MAG: hypothetical protein AAF441_00790 [Pseudomonadota bacterium]
MDGGIPPRPVFAARSDAAQSAGDGRYVLFEQAPLTGDWILQGAATKALFTDWVSLRKTDGLPLLSDFDASRHGSLMQFAVGHLVRSRQPLVFEVAFVGEECARILGMSRERRLLEAESDSLNTADAYKRISDAAAYRHPHFAVKTLGWQGRDLTKYEVLILPYGQDGVEGTAATLSVMSFSSGFDASYWLTGGV